MTHNNKSISLDKCSSIRWADDLSTCFCYMWRRKQYHLQTTTILMSNIHQYNIENVPKIKTKKKQRINIFIANEFFSIFSVCCSLCYTHTVSLKRSEIIRATEKFYRKEENEILWLWCFFVWFFFVLKPFDAFQKFFLCFLVVKETNISTAKWLRIITHQNSK